jgi:hypothetical protein
MILVIVNEDAYTQMVKLDSVPPIQIQVTNDDDTVYNLSGHTLTLDFNKSLGTSSTGYGVNKFSKDFIITDPVNGEAEYRWERTTTTNDLNEDGSYYYDIILNGPDVTASVITPVAGAGNTGGDTAASGGTYTGLKDTAYIVTVTTAGAMGGTTAEVTISGSGGESFSGDTFKPTSGAAFDLGTLGATLTLTEAGTAGMVLGDSWYIEAIATSPGFRKTLNTEPKVIVARKSLV